MTNENFHRQRARLVAVGIVLAVVGIIAWSWWGNDPDPTKGRTRRSTTTEDSESEVLSSTSTDSASESVPPFELIATADGVPLSGVEVRVDDSESPSAVTNESGVAELPDLPADGVVKLEASHAQWGSATREVSPGDSGPVFVAHESDSMVRATLQFMGLVSIAEIAVFDEEGVKRDSREYRTHGAGDKRYEVTFYPLPPGRFVLRAFLPGGGPLGECGFEIPRNGDLVELPLHWSVSETGIAVEASQLSGFAYVDGKPLRNHFLKVRSPEGEQPPVLTDDDGKFEFDQLVPDMTLLTFEVSDVELGVEPFRTPPRDSLQVHFHSSVRRRLWLTGANGNPIVGSQVSIWWNGRVAATVTSDENGAISLDGFANAEYDVMVWVVDVESGEVGATQFGPYPVRVEGRDAELRIERPVTTVVATFDSPESAYSPNLVVLHESRSGTRNKALGGRVPVSLVLPDEGRLWVMAYLDTEMNFDGEANAEVRRDLVFAGPISCAAAPREWKLQRLQSEPADHFEVRLPNGERVTDVRLQADPAASQAEADLLAFVESAVLKNLGNGSYALARFRAGVPDLVWLVSSRGACPVDLREGLHGIITLEPGAALEIIHRIGTRARFVVECESGRRIELHLSVRETHSNRFSWKSQTTMTTGFPIPDGEVPLRVVVTNAEGEHVVPIRAGAVDLTGF